MKLRIVDRKYLIWSKWFKIQNMKDMKILWLDDLRNPYIDLEGRVPKEKGIVEWVLSRTYYLLDFSLYSFKK